MTITNVFLRKMITVKSMDMLTKMVIGRIRTAKDVRKYVKTVRMDTIWTKIRNAKNIRRTVNKLTIRENVRNANRGMNWTKTKNVKRNEAKLL